jgi:uncharacterized protein (TIGR02217 family)
MSFPRRLSFGANSDPAWLTELATTSAGFDSTNQPWSQTRHHFDVSFAVRTADDYIAVREHFHTMRGRAKAFLFRDPLDNQVALANGVVGALEGSPTAWQLFRRYGSGNDLYDRRITRPVSGTLTVWRTRSMVTTNVTGSCVFDYGGSSTEEPGGTFIVSGHQSGDTYSWSGQFMVPCRYDIDRLPGLIVNRRPGEDGPLLVQCDAIPLVEVRERD